MELIALYKAMLAARRDETTNAIDRYVSGVEKLKSTAEQVGGLEEDLKVKAVEVDEKKAQCDAMIPKLEAEKAKANKEGGPPCGPVLTTEDLAAIRDHAQETLMELAGEP